MHKMAKYLLSPTVQYYSEARDALIFEVWRTEAPFSSPAERCEADDEDYDARTKEWQTFYEKRTELM